MVLKRRGNGNIALTFFGEGTSSRGDVHEAMNWAAVMKLPVVFVCNNNGWAYSTPPGKQYAVKSLAVRGPAYGMPGASVDGNDVLAVYREVGNAVVRARGGKGPSFVECKTFRMTGHSAHDDAEYVPPKFFKEWQRKDPIQRFEKWLLQKKIVNRARIRSLEEEIRREVDNAVAALEASPFPRPEECLEGVYCGPECWWDGRPGPGAPEGARRKGQNRA
jgi:TPP-dependent pyruvate/acetoin dehydrogenase alpha subunit